MFSIAQQLQLELNNLEYPNSKLCSVELHNLYSPRNMVKVIELRRMR